MMNHPLRWPVITLAALWLFLTVKVLEARKWS